MAGDDTPAPLGSEDVADSSSAAFCWTPRSAMHRATVSVNDILLGVLEQLMEAQRLTDLPPALRSAIDHLTIEVAKVQGVSEWVAEDLVRLVEGELDEDP